MTWTPSADRTLIYANYVSKPSGGVITAPPSMIWPSKAAASVLDFNIDLTGAFTDDGDMTASVSALAVAPTDTVFVLEWVTLFGNTFSILAAGGTPSTTYSIQFEVTSTSGRTLALTALLPISASAPPASLPAQQPPPNALVFDGGSPLLFGDGSQLLF